MMDFGTRSASPPQAFRASFTCAITAIADSFRFGLSRVTAILPPPTIVASFLAYDAIDMDPATRTLLVVTGLQREAAIAAGDRAMTLCSGGRPHLLIERLT